MLTSKLKDCWFPKVPWWTPHSFTRQVRPRIGNRRVVLKCAKRRRESHGTWHEGADVDLEAVHTVEVTVANEADINVLPKLLRVEDDVIFSDAGCTSDEYKRGSRQLGIRWCVQDKLKPVQSLRGSQKKRNRKHFSLRARVEHVFRAIKW